MFPAAGRYGLNFAQQRWDNNFIFQNFAVIFAARKSGKMPEWSNGAVSKTVELLVGSGGSNPPLSAEDEEKKLSSSLEQLFFFIFCKARRRRAGMCDRREQIPPKRGMADKVGLVLPPSRPSPRGRLSRFAPNPHFGFFFFIFCKARRRRAGMCDRREQIPQKRGMAGKVGLFYPLPNLPLRRA